MPQINNLVIHQHKLIWFCIPKIANGSIKWALKTSFDLTGMEYVTKHEAQLLRYQHGYLTIAMLRNPYERTISTYMHKIAHKHEGEMSRFIRYGYWPGMAFDDYLDVLQELPDDQSDVHIQSQSYRIMINGAIIPEYIYRFELLPESWKSACYRIKLHTGVDVCALEHRNQSEGVRPELTMERRMKIENRYGPDIELLRGLRWL